MGTRPCSGTRPCGGGLSLTSELNLVEELVLVVVVCPWHGNSTWWRLLVLVVGTRPCDGTCPCGGGLSLTWELDPVEELVLVVVVCPRRGNSTWWRLLVLVIGTLPCSGTQSVYFWNFPCWGHFVVEKTCILSCTMEKWWIPRQNKIFIGSVGNASISPWCMGLMSMKAYFSNIINCWPSSNELTLPRLPKYLYCQNLKEQILFYMSLGHRFRCVTNELMNYNKILKS